MNLSGSHQNCTEDFLQFGRDVLFITTHLRLEVKQNIVFVTNIFVSSAKVCGTISKFNLTEDLVSDRNVDLRHYSEETDTEMDFWIYMTNTGRPDKYLDILVTPYRKVCDPRDHFYRACHRKNRSVSGGGRILSISSFLE